MADGSPALFSNIPLWADILLSAGCVCISAYFAGTTLGVLSLDKIGLQIIAKASDDEKERRHASASKLLCLGLGIDPANVQHIVRYCFQVDLSLS